MISVRKLLLSLIRLFILTIPLEISKMWIPVLLLDTDFAGHSVSVLDLSRIVLLASFVVILFFILDKLSFPRIPIGYFLPPMALLGIYFISGLITPAPRTAQNEIFRLLFHIFFAGLVVWAVRSIDYVVSVVKLFCWTTVALGVVVMIQWVTGFYFWNGEILAVSGRYNATLADPNILARYIVIGFFGWLLSRPRKTLGGILIKYFALTCCLFAIAMSYSRGAWVLFLVVILWLALFSDSYQRKRARIILFFTFILGGVMVSFMPNFRERLATLSDGISALGARTSMIQAGIAMFFDHPLFGVGLGGYPVEYVTNYRQYLSYYGESVNLSHTYLVTTAAELGVIGLIVLSTSAFHTTRIYGRVRKYYSLDTEISSTITLLYIGLVAIFMSSQTEGRFWEDPLLWVLWGLLMASHKISALSNMNRSRSEVIELGEWNSDSNAKVPHNL